MRALLALALLTLCACGATAVEVMFDQAVGSPEVTGTVNGWVGFVVYAGFKTNAFSGRVSGNAVDVLLTSMADPDVMGACSSRLQLHLTGQLSGDILTGTSTSRG